MYKKTFYSDNFTVDPAFCSIDPNMLAMHSSPQQQDDVSPYVVPASVMPPTPTPFLDPSATPFSPDEGLDDFPIMYHHEEDTTGMVDVAVAPYLTNYYQQYHQHTPQPTTVDNITTPNMGASNTHYQQQQDHHLFPALAKVFTCPTCHRQFNRRYNLGTHIKTHDKKRHRPFPCSECPKRFDRKHDRKRHVQTVHRGEKLYPCDQCNAEFSRKDALMRHKDQKHVELQYLPEVHGMYE
ncbi:hypothetical protein K492DRAFT_171895 [Lichtheimia hyalospora FSU 10163]|nr:hypothetical protein K492DRAFT_171895 [Lichtheimia hyalospora FSU 10163]